MSTSPHHGVRSGDVLPEAYVALHPASGDDGSPVPSQLSKRRRLLGRIGLGLRSRATLSLALGSLVISVAVASLTYAVARRILLEERRLIVQQLVFSDAAEIQSVFAKTGTKEIGATLRRQNRPDLSSVLITPTGTYVSNEVVSPLQVPASLRDVVRNALASAPGVGPASRTPAAAVGDSRATEPASGPGALGSVAQDPLPEASAIGAEPTGGSDPASIVDSSLAGVPATGEAGGDTAADDTASDAAADATALPPIAPEKIAGAAPGDADGFAFQTVKGRRNAELIVGVPLTAIDSEFYGIASLDDVEDRLRALARTLASAALLSAFGAALLGRWMVRRALHPLSDVAAGAADISSGRLDTRLELTGDADLDPLLSSFNDMAASLQGRIEREARFASDVSHELRTPLTALVTAARLLDGRRDELSERSQKTLDVLVMQTGHFERLVLDLLEISRFDAGAADLNAEVVHLPDFVRTVIRVNGCDAILDWQEFDPPEVCVDKRRVERMVANLIQNAANYGGGATAVRLANVASDPEERDDARRIRIVVDDAGPGIPEEEREVIFERFRRGQSQKRAANAPKGTGLGLALVRAHANLHGGDVHVRDRPGGGARFEIDLVEALEDLE